MAAPPVYMTMSEVCEKDESMQRRAQAIARRGNVEHCTHDEGALNQPVYACITCQEHLQAEGKGQQFFGVCFGCSMTCHLDHQIEEVWAPVPPFFVLSRLAWLAPPDGTRQCVCTLPVVGLHQTKLPV